jgi:oxygen-independent coproporphyrinogen-3 oxidase
MTGWRDPDPSDTSEYEPEAVFEAGLLNHHVSSTAYPIAHETTWRPYRVCRERIEEVAASAWLDIDELGLYAHVPFCETRCSFCEYTVTKRSEHPMVDAYMEALERELDLWDRAVGLSEKTLGGLDIGGGTPSFVPAESIERFLARVKERLRLGDGADVSIETTPRIAAEEPGKIAAYRRAGVDRISMGIQVVEPDLLRVLNREANGIETHLRAVEHIREAGFDRLNVDLMYGFKDQSLESWRRTLEWAVGLGPEYVTLYRMRYKLTRISHQAPFVTLDDVRPMEKLAKAVLLDAGYFATTGKTTFSRIPNDVGTSSYLARRVVEGMPYLGLGLGAQSFTDRTISYNDGAAAKALHPYLRSVGAGRLPIQDLYDLPPVQMMGKMCSVSFYFGEIHLPSFERKFGRSLEAAYPAAFEFVLREGLMELASEMLRLTPRGAEHKNGIHALFYAPSIQAYLLERDPERASDFERNRRAASRVSGEELVHV